MRWPWQPKPEPPANSALSISDPALAALFTPGGVVDLAGVSVSEQSALGLSALFRGVSLISGTLASLPLRSLRLDDSGAPQQVSSVFDDPDPDGQTPFEWKETLLAHLVIHGRAGALKVRNQAQGLVRLPLVHPLCFYPELPSLEEFKSGKLPVGGLWFRVTLADGSQARLDADDFWYVPAIATTPGFGQGLMQLARRSLSTAIAGDMSAAKMFSSGALISGLATPADDTGLDISEDIPQIRQELNRSVLGHENAGTIAIVARRLQFTPWTMTAQQAQFIESRQFQIEEISRWTGVPPHLLMQTEKQTSWGTGVDEQNRGLSKFVLGHWAQRVEQRASRLLARPRWAEFDFAALERPNFETNVGLVLQQIAAGLISAEYGRKLLNIPPDAAPAEAPAPAPDPNGGDDDPAAE